MSQQIVNYYEFLGVKPNCTEEDLDFHYQEIVKFLSPEYHPEKTYTKKDIEIVMEQLDGVNEAYRVLKDPKLRKAHDEALRRKVEIPTPQTRILEQPKKQEQPRRVQQPRRQEIRPVTPPRRVSTPQVEARRMKEKKTFWQNVKDSYRAVRLDERNFSFKKRHAKMAEAFDDKYAKKVTSVPKEILFYTGKGTAHVFLEAFYQLSRLSYINKDTVTKYVIRNRRLIAAAALIGIMASCGGTAKEEPIAEPQIVRIEVPAPEVTEPIKIEVPAEEPRLVLTRHYTIVAGDTLSRLANNANSSVEELKRINGYENDKIYFGRKMTIPYTIDREDLEYYTESIKMNDFSLEEIANAYETDLETLYQLNNGAIIYTNGKYYALSNTILVPRFHSKQEVEALKAEKTNTNH